jgi:hypothetical protein
METIPEKTQATPLTDTLVIPAQNQKNDDADATNNAAEQELAERLKSKGVDFHSGTHPASTISSTESLGHRNVRAHRRVQSTSLFSILDAPSFTPLRARSMSMADAFPSLDKYYPGSHLVDYGGVEDSNCLFLSLWLLPPEPLRTTLSKHIAKLAMRYNHHGSSAPFMPHVTIVGSIRCETHRDATQLGLALQKGMKGSGPVPCRFQNNEPNATNNDHNSHKPKSCVAMYNNEHQLVWSQSCIALMERSEEYMNLIELSRALLKLPKGEWMFPGPACEPHMSTFYGKCEIKDHQVPYPPDFVATEAALYMTTPGTLQGVAKWREVARIPLL